MFREDLLKGKRIFVTGGGTGLGRTMTEHFAALGADVYICGRREAKLTEAADEINARGGGTVHTRVLDIRDPEAVDAVVESIFAEGPLDGLVNNAAGNFISPTKDLSHRGFDAIAGIVFHGTFYVTHAVGRRWIDAGHKGSVLSITTTWVWTGSPFVVPSAMSKGAINIMTKSLAAEWGRYGIRVNCIAPGPFPTEGAWARLSPGSGLGDGDYTDQIPLGRVGRLDELGPLAVYLMADGSEYITGQTVAIDGGSMLGGGGTFWGLQKLSDDDWGKIREMIRAANDKDKAARKG